VIGDVWKALLANAGLKKPFFDLASKCRSVVACRLEPKEKADIVSMVKSIEQVTCLAIGNQSFTSTYPSHYMT
jgi:magnesium-transporting ATPase (P-type)